MNDWFSSSAPSFIPKTDPSPTSSEAHVFFLRWCLLLFHRLHEVLAGCVFASGCSTSSSSCSNNRFSQPQVKQLLQNLYISTASTNKHSVLILHNVDQPPALYHSCCGRHRSGTIFSSSLGQICSPRETTDRRSAARLLATKS